jgi:hypothetical protein
MVRSRQGWGRPDGGGPRFWALSCASSASCCYGSLRRDVPWAPLPGLPCASAGPAGAASVAGRARAASKWLMSGMPPARRPQGYTVTKPCSTGCVGTQQRPWSQGCHDGDPRCCRQRAQVLLAPVARGSRWPMREGICAGATGCSEVRRRGAGAGGPLAASLLFGQACCVAQTPHTSEYSNPRGCCMGSAPPSPSHCSNRHLASAVHRLNTGSLLPCASH